MKSLSMVRSISALWTGQRPVQLQKKVKTTLSDKCVSTKSTTERTAQRNTADSVHVVPGAPNDSKEHGVHAECQRVDSVREQNHMDELQTRHRVGRTMERLGK